MKPLIKLTKAHKLLIGLIVLTILSPGIVYFIQFRNYAVSKTPADWGPFGDFFGGVLNPIFSLLTLIVTIIIALYLKKADDEKNDKSIGATYIPHLVIEQDTFYTYPSKIYNNEKPVEFSKTSKDFQYESDLHSPNLFSVDVYNIGMGTAKNIEIKYESDLKLILDFLSEFSQPLDLDQRINVSLNHGKKVNHLEINYPASMGKGTVGIFLPEKDDTLKITHLLNVATLDKPLNLQIPNYYLELYTHFLYIFWKRLQLGDGNLPDFPPLSIILDYRDIQDRKFDKKFLVRLSMLHGSNLEFRHALTVKEIEHQL